MQCSLLQSCRMQLCRLQLQAATFCLNLQASVEHTIRKAKSSGV